MRYSSAEHTRFYHRFHVVWVTKYRYKVLQSLMRERIHEIIVQTCAEMGGTCHAYVPASQLIYAAFRSKANGLLPPNDNCRLRGV